MQPIGLCLTDMQLAKFVCTIHLFLAVAIDQQAW